MQTEPGFGGVAAVETSTGKQTDIDAISAGIQSLLITSNYQATARSCIETCRKEGTSMHIKPLLADNKNDSEVGEMRNSMVLMLIIRNWATA